MRRNGSSSSARADGSHSGIRVGLRRDRGLSEGMAIVAAIEARLFRFRLLSLNAVVDIVPAEVERDLPLTETVALVPPGRASRRRPPGRDLAAASRAIEAGAEDLRRARRRMP